MLTVIAQLLLYGGLLGLFAGLLIGIFRPYTYRPWIFWGSGFVTCLGYALIDPTQISSWGLLITIGSIFASKQFGLSKYPYIIWFTVGMFVTLAGSIQFLGYDVFSTIGAFSSLLPIGMLIISILFLLFGRKKEE